jgi:hypothetical protein
MAARQSTRCEMPVRLRLFLAENLGDRDSVYSREWFLDNLANKRDGIGLSEWYCPLRPLRESRGTCLPTDTSGFYQEVYSFAWDLLNRLQQACRRAARDIQQFGIWAGIRDNHLPTFQELARSASLLTTASAEYYSPLDLRRATDGEYTGACEEYAECLFQFQYGYCGRKRWPARPEFYPLELEFGLPQAHPRRIVRPRITIAQSLPPPYGGVFGTVCADALSWLGVLGDPRCKACGRPMERQRITKQYCSQACKKADYRRRTPQQIESLTSL